MKESNDIDRIVENEREWRKFTLEKIVELDKKLDRVDKELGTFKARVFTMATMVGGFAGFSFEWVAKKFGL